ncbi:unnamed protein product, partial [Tenebrio molitor]
MGSSNVKALKDLKSSLERPFFMFEDKQIWRMMDSPHLLKCTVALFRKYNVLLPVLTDDGKQHKMEASFNDMVSPLIFRVMYKLKEVHLAPVMRFAMKVGIAAQIMSRTYTNIYFLISITSEIEQRILATATFVSQVDELFDSFNGTQINTGAKPLKCAISEESPHSTYWGKAYQ